MLDKLLGIKSLEDTDPVELEEVDESLSTPMPEEYAGHGQPVESEPGFDPDAEGE